MTELAAEDIRWMRRALALVRAGGAGRGQVHDMYFEDRHMNTIDFIRDPDRADLSLHGGVLAEECAALYIPPGAPIPVEQQFNR